MEGFDEIRIMNNLKESKENANNSKKKQSVASSLGRASYQYENDDLPKSFQISSNTINNLCEENPILDSGLIKINFTARNSMKKFVEDMKIENKNFSENNISFNPVMKKSSFSISPIKFQKTIFMRKTHQETFPNIF